MTPDRRKELRFRLIVSLGGLVLLAVAVVLRGWPPSAAMIEVFGIAAAFFGGTALWTLNQLRKD